MTKRHPIRALTPSPSRGTRWLALLCLLMASVMGTVQAVHVHGDLLPENAATWHAPADAGQTLGGEEHCPLCVAMHSAMPVAAPVPMGAAVLSEVTVVEHAMVAPERRWHFAMFSRPPPAGV